MMCGGLALVIDGMRANRRLPALLGGLAIGLTILVRIDGLRDVLPVSRSRAADRAAQAHGTGAVSPGSRSASERVCWRDTPCPARTSTTCAAPDPAAVHRGGRGRASRSCCSVVVRRWGLPDLTRFRLPDLAALATFAVLAFFAARPAFQTVRRVPNNPDDQANAAYISAAAEGAAAAVRPQPPVLRAESALGEPGTSACPAVLLGHDRRRPGRPQAAAPAPYGLGPAVRGDRLDDRDDAVAARDHARPAVGEPAADRRGAARAAAVRAVGGGLGGPERTAARVRRPDRGRHRGGGRRY